MRSSPSPRRAECRSQAARFAPRLVIMSKEPAAGRVKTRLARDLGVVTATAAYRALTAALIATLGQDRRWTTTLALAPDAAIATRMFDARVLRMPQGPGNLGERLQRITASAPDGPLVIIGADCPAIPASAIATAFRKLGNNDVVLGPTDDGGYWLVGLRRRPRALRIFDNVRWSTDNALSDTLRNCKGLTVSEIERRADVDVGCDYSKLREKIGRRFPPR
jgi:rSAM/selenodomain-associated transferase 1